MTFPRVPVVAVILSLALVPMLAQSPEADLQRAVQKELATGDLGASILEYVAIASRTESTNRSVAAQALLRAAAAHAKRGDGKEREIYRRVAAQFADQPEIAAQARARLGESAPAPAVVWNRAKVDTYGNGSVSRDGRQIAYVDWETGNLALHDVATGIDRPLTNLGNMRTNPGIYAGLSAFSPDGDRLAFAWFDQVRGRYDIRMVSTRGTDVPPYTTVYDNENSDWVHPYDWSRDGRYLAFQVQRTDRTGQIGVIDVSNGRVQVLKSFPWTTPSRGMRFSPDGRFLAFDLAAEPQGASDVYLLAVDGSRETAAVVQPSDEELVGWNPDGSQVLFLSDRSGPWSLWAIAVKDGKPWGPANAIRSTVAPERGRFAPLGFTQTGALVYAISRATNSGINVAQMDFASARLVSPPRDAGLELSTIGGGAEFSWNASGQALAVSRRVRPGVDNAQLLTLKDVGSGAIREIQPRWGGCSVRPQWSANGSFVICQGVHFDSRAERPGVVRMDGATGVVTFVAAGRAPALTRDGRTVYLLRYPEGQSSAKGVALIEHQLASGAERELLRRESLALLRLSPDGRLLATISRSASTSERALLLVPVAGDQAREVLALRGGETFGPGQSGLFWAPDGHSVFVMKAVSGAKPTFVRVALDGTVTNHPDLELGNDVNVHPDGRQVAYSVPTENVVEVHRLDGIASRR